MFRARTQQIESVTADSVTPGVVFPSDVVYNWRTAAIILAFASCMSAVSTSGAFAGKPPRHASVSKKPANASKDVHLPMHVTKVVKASAKSFRPFGPPLPPDRLAVVIQATQLVKDWKAGRLVLVNNQRDGEQLSTLEATGIYFWPLPEKKQPVIPNSHDLMGASGEDDAARPAPGKSQISARHATTDLRTSLPGLSGPSNTDASSLTPSIPPAAGLLKLLRALSSHSTMQHPLVVLSLLRPPYQTAYWRHAGPHNPHSLGYAADIAEYRGHRISQERPEECVQAMLAMLRDLPPARYRLGVPKAPEAPVIVGKRLWPTALTQLLTILTPPDARTSLEQPIAKELPSRHLRRRQNNGAQQGISPSIEVGTVGVGGAALGLACSGMMPGWPFFPAPEPELKDGVVAASPASNGKVSLGSNGQRLPRFLKFRNENYADEKELADPRVKRALQAAHMRRVDVVAMFPDASDHIHIDVWPVK